MADQAIEQARKALTRQVLRATTLPEIAAARLALREWLKAYPEEQGMRDGFEQLAQIEDIAQMELLECDNSEHCQTPDPLR